MEWLARGQSDWLHPNFLGQTPEVAALLPYWLGAWAAQWAPDSWIAVRLPFVLLLGLSLMATWYACYHLARSPLAQPVAFAFGGEAQPADYARALSDGALLALLASLGLAQLGHETTPAVAQLAASTLMLYGLGALQRHPRRALAWFGVGQLALTLSGAPALAALLALAGLGILGWERSRAVDSPGVQRSAIAGILLSTAVSLILAVQLNLLRWRIELPAPTATEWISLIRLVVWFTWPTWPLTLWTLWRWRAHWWRATQPARHVLIPLAFVVVLTISALVTPSADRGLLLALPALAILAAFALPTLQRSVSALVDWFTLLFFSTCGLLIWIIWIAVQTGVPRQPAANVARLAPGYVPEFQIAPFLIAALASAAWLALVRWRTGRHRAAIWKSLALPAGGAVWCWILLMTLWLPMLDYGRGYQAMLAPLRARIASTDCVDHEGLGTAQRVALRLQTGVMLRPIKPVPATGAACSWLITGTDTPGFIPVKVDTKVWESSLTLQHPVDRMETLWVYRRRATAP